MTREELLKVLHGNSDYTWIELFEKYAKSIGKPFSEELKVAILHNIIDESRLRLAKEQVLSYFIQELNINTIFLKNKPIKYY